MTIRSFTDHSEACRRLDSRRSSSITLFTAIKVIDGNLFDFINVTVGEFRFAVQNYRRQKFQVSLTAVYLIAVMMNRTQHFYPTVESNSAVLKQKLGIFSSCFHLFLAFCIK